MAPDDNRGLDKDSKLMVYFMGQTNERLVQIEAKLVELIAFRSEVLASAKVSSIAVSAVMGVAVLIATYIMRKMGL